MSVNGALKPPLRILMVTPHLPPEWAANAILPVQLGSVLNSFGAECRFLAHSSPGKRGVLANAYYAPRRGRGRWSRMKIGAVIAAIRIAICALPLIKSSDVFREATSDRYVLYVDIELLREFAVSDTVV